MICVPLASVVPARLFRSRDRLQVPQILLAGLILAFLVKPALDAMQTSLAMDVAARNAEWVGLENLLKDKRVFSAVPRVAFLTHAPPVTEPFLIRFLELAGATTPARCRTASGRASSI